MRRFLAALLAAVLAAGVAAHVRLVHPSNGNELYWNVPTSVGIVISSTGSDDVADASEEVALRLAIQEWNGLVGTSAELVEDQSTASQARTDWQADDLHQILFDETNASGYFPPGSGTVAITPIWFLSSGRISDADILFNGLGFSFTTSAEAGRFDVADVGAHELGHLLGLNHSGWAGATMYPYVDPTIIEHRSLSADELAGLRDAYPIGSFGRITGTILRSDASPVSGAHVVAREATGRTAASSLSESVGDFTIVGLDAGVYGVYARPFDEPVAASHLGSGYTIDTDFAPASYAATATITGANSVGLGDLVVPGDASLNLGRSSDLYPLRAVAGETCSHVVRGTGLFPGSTLRPADSDLTITNVNWFGSQVTFQVIVPAGEPNGHVDLEVENSVGDVSILTGALELTPPAPIVSSVDPSSGSTAGGTTLSISGANFGAGARVVIGPEIYTDGVNATVAGGDTITLTTAAIASGAHDVVVIDGSGEEGRLDDGFLATAVPAIASVFPGIGQASGGTQIALSGQDFLDGLLVRIDGVEQLDVAVESSTLARFTTAAGIVGGPYVLELENPDGSLAQSVFTFGASPDPAPLAVAPAEGSPAGGDVVTLSGANFTSTCGVVFGVDPDTGAGGSAAGVLFLDANTLQVTTPPHAKGCVSVMVSDEATEQVGVLELGFDYGVDGSGGGGGCSLRPLEDDLGGPGSPRAVAAGAWWMALLALALALRARRGARRALRA
jgi:hypothetical protein